MNPRQSFEIERAYQLTAEAAELRGRLEMAVMGLHAAIARTSTGMGQLRAAVGVQAEPGPPVGASNLPALRPAVPHEPIAYPPTAYAVYLEGGPFTHAKRAAAARRYRQALETHYGSAAAVLEAMQSTDPVARERWNTAKAYARWSALAPREFASEADFQIRRGREFTSG